MIDRVSPHASLRLLRPPRAGGPGALPAGAVVKSAEAVEAGLPRGGVAPLLDDGLLHAARVDAVAHAHLLGDVNAVLGRLQAGNQLGDVAALALRLKGAHLLRHLLDDLLFEKKNQNR